LKRIATGINPFCDLVLLGIGEAGNKILLRMDGLVSGSQIGAWVVAQYMSGKMYGRIARSNLQLWPWRVSTDKRTCAATEI
jgi:hypothetical protein